MSPHADALITQHRSVFQQPLAGKRILIVGASTRAAAESVLRSGGIPVCVDQFADLDLQQIATVIPVRQFTDSLSEDVAGQGIDAWFYAGGLENAPQVLERLEQSLPGEPLGCSSVSVRKVRDPWRLRQTLLSHGLPALELRPEDEPPPPDGAWLRKPRRGAGGRAVMVWDSMAATEPLHEPHHFQQRAMGEIASAVFTTSSSRAECHGVCQQLVGLPEAGAPHPFAWCGGIAPIPVSPELLSRLNQLGQILVREFGLQGLFGVDLALQGDDFRVLEVNPRYPASAELFELALGQSLLSPAESRRRPRCVGKLVLYARQDFRAPDWSHWARSCSPWAVTPVRDIPAPGSPVLAGQPVCTVLATGSSPERCRHRLLARARRWTERLQTARFVDS